MKIRFVTTVFVLMAAGCALPGARHRARALPETPPEEQEVVRTIERLFDGMRTRDTAALRGLLAPHLVFISARESGDHWSIGRYSVADFLGDIAQSTAGAEDLHERMWGSDVHVDGAIATLWATYDFHVGSTLDHCGHDAFQLARGEGGWYVTAIIYTVRPAPCPTPPPPAQ